MTVRTFRDRTDAGRALAELLTQYRDRPDAIVLALPRGGVPVAYEVATRLHLPLDVFLVRKLGVPSHPELAMGALASGDVVVTNDAIVRAEHIGPGELQRVTEREERELRRREHVYRGDRRMPEIADKTVIVVDDGLATGATMRAALTALQRMDPRRTVAAVPAAAATVCRELQSIADEVVCASTPSPFYAVGAAYLDFEQTSDDEVRELLRLAAGGAPH
jgi:predicted phosphoribosyltransferase